MRPRYRSHVAFAVAFAAAVVVQAARPALVAFAQAGGAPDLFDETIVRDFDVRFADADWQRRLDQAGESTNVRADLTVDGVTYRGVGLRYKGLSSSRAPGPKKPFNLTIDAFTPGQRLYGFDTVNLNNSYADPSYLREVLTNDLLRPFLPTPRGTYAKLHLNGDYWGLYILSEQIERTFLGDWFQGNDGLLVKADNPTFGEQMPRADGSAAGPRARTASSAPRRAGPVAPFAPFAPFGPAQGAFGLQSNLTWRGEGLAPYKQEYEVKTAGAGDAGYEALRELIRALDAPAASGGLTDDQVEAGLPATLDVDSALWYLAATNAVLNYDSYYFGHNYFLHRAQADDRWYPLLWDTSLSFGVFNIAGGGYGGLVRTNPFLQAADANRPLVRRLLAVPRWRADFIAHFRTVRAAALDADTVEARAIALRDLIRPALAADTNQLYTLELFEKSLEEDVSLGPGAVIVSNGDIPGILPLVRARSEWLGGQPAFKPPFHALLEHQRAPEAPAPGASPRVRARFGGADDPAAVEVVLRVEGGAPASVPMVRDGDSWTADLPGLPTRTRVTYYLHATFADGRTAFHPASNWVQPYRYRVAGPALPERPGGDLALNEIMADNAAVIADEAGEYDDWVELVNRGMAPVALEGYFLGPSSDDPWAFALPAGTLRPGERLLVWCDKDTAQGPLHAPFKLAKGGDGIVLASRDAIADVAAFGPLAADRSWARWPDGDGGWVDCASPSPRAVNACGDAPRATITAPAPPTATIPPTPTATASAAPTATASPDPTASARPPEPTATVAPPRRALFLPWGHR